MPVTTQDIKKLLARTFQLQRDPKDIPDDTPIVGEGLGLDSVDVLEIVLLLDQEFGVKVKRGELGPSDFNTIESLTAVVNRLKKS